MLIGAVSHFLWQMWAKVITFSSQRWNLFSVSFSMFYHGNIKIWEAKFNQHWESEIVPGVEVETCSHSVWASAASTALSDGDEGSWELSRPQPCRSPLTTETTTQVCDSTIPQHGTTVTVTHFWSTFFFFFFPDDKIRHSRDWLASGIFLNECWFC